MSRTLYDDIWFDSDLEVRYYKHIKELEEKGIVKQLVYQPKVKIEITKNNKYTPDFIVCYEHHIEIVETKGFNQFSYQRDNIIHNVMKAKTRNELAEYVNENGIYTCGRECRYSKVKYLQSVGWVDFDWKNPNTLSNKRKNQRDELKVEVKELQKQLKEYKRYFDYSLKTKLTQKQKEWLDNFVKTNITN